jgi:hypothetical protein
VITQEGVGPFNAKTEGTEATITKLVPSLRVVTHDLGGESGIVFDVFDGYERLFYIVPDDAVGWTDDQGNENRYASTVFAVFAVSERVNVQGRGWRVSKPLGDAKGLDRCECWGEREVTACFQTGSHIRVIFEQSCEEAEKVGGQAMIGQPIARIMWKRVVNDLPREGAPDDLPIP